MKRYGGNEMTYLLQALGLIPSPGSLNERLETAFANKYGTRYAVTANSGTSTLHMALKAFGVGPGDEVIIPALTVGMCGFVVHACGATPVYADVDPVTFLMDVDDVRSKITEKTKAIMPVHIYGLMCDMTGIMKLAEEHKLWVVEDCAECFLAYDDQGYLCGTVGDVGSWSFEGSKHMSCGEGGIVATNDPALAEKMRKFGGLGFRNLTAAGSKVRIPKDKFQDPNWKRHDTLALNYRLSEPSAAIALAQLERLEYFVETRRFMAGRYAQIIKDTETCLLVPQQVPVGFRHSYWTYACRFDGDFFGIEWKQFRQKYVENGGDGIYAAWQIVPNEPAFDGIGRGKAPVAETLQTKIMQFTTNQLEEEDMVKQEQALIKTLEYFEV
jgi:perosamine synthetase